MFARVSGLMAWLTVAVPVTVKGLGPPGRANLAPVQLARPNAHLSVITNFFNSPLNANGTR